MHAQGHDTVLSLASGHSTHWHFFHKLDSEHSNKVLYHFNHYVNFAIETNFTHLTKNFRRNHMRRIIQQRRSFSAHEQRALRSLLVKSTNRTADSLPTEITSFPTFPVDLRLGNYALKKRKKTLFQIVAPIFINFIILRNDKRVFIE